MRRLLWALMASLALAGASVAVPATGAGAQQNADSDDADAHVTAVVLAYIRYGGADRYETSLAVAEAYAGLHDDKLDHVVLVSGERWTDAVVAAPLAGLHGAPVLMMPPGDMPGLGNGNTVVVVMGGTAALAQPVEDAIVDAGMKVTRLAGATRYDTAILAAELAEDRYQGLSGTSCFDSTSYGVARAHLPFDAFSAAPLLARLCTSLLLTDPDAVPVPTAEYLDLKMQRLTQETDADFYLMLMFVFGGDAAVSQDSLDTYLAEATQRIAEGRAGQIDPEPDGDRIAYVRGYQDGDRWVSHIWTVNANGTRNTQLTRGDTSRDQRPRWSPDGASIGFQRTLGERQFLALMDRDGKNERALTTHGYLEAAPAWSPDGKLLAFHTITSDGKHRSFVVGARGAPVRRAADCRPERTGSYSTGFPRSRENLPATGKLRIGVLFVDFADVPATEAIDTEIGRNLTPFEAILERSSYGKLDVEFVPHRTWLRSSLQATDESRSGPSPYELFEEVVELAGDDVDFSTLDHVIVALSSAKFWLSATTPVAGFQGPLPPMTLLNGDYRPDFGGPNSWAAWGASHLVARGRFTLPTAGPSTPTQPMSNPRKCWRGRDGSWIGLLPSPVSGGARSNYPRLLEEGVLIYTVDAFLNEGNLPIKLAGDSGNGQVEGFPVLGVGDSIELRGYQIAVEADTGDTHRVRIRKLN